MADGSNFQFYTKTGYFDDLIQRVTATGPGDRVAVAAMSVEPSIPHIVRLLDALGQAAARGASVNLIVDAYVFLRAHSPILRDKLGPLFFDITALASPAKLTGVYRDTYDALEKLRAQGVRYTVTNVPHRKFKNPYSGRSHIKYAVINDRVYIGGCNLDRPADIDVMTAWPDSAFADQLFNFSNDTISHAGTGFMMGADRELKTSNDDSVFIDSGKKRQSIILEKALRLIDDAKDHIFMTCQYFPNSLTARRLAAAHGRGVKVSIVYNHASKFPKPDHILQHISATIERQLRSAALFKDQLPLTSPYIHAKILATESSAMIGSHNYIAAGVNFGTAEIALLRHDADFSQQLITALKSQIVSDV